MEIKVLEDLCPIINGAAIGSAPSVAELHALLGPPSFIAEPKTPAPVGHRNNQWHVYETAGVLFYEHHYTRRVTGCSVVFQPEDIEVPVVLPQPFAGRLQLGNIELPPDIGMKDIRRKCGIEFKASLGNSLIARRERFAVMLIFKKAKRPSGRLGRALRLVSIELSWPHDPWGEPADGEP